MQRQYLRGKSKGTVTNYWLYRDKDQSIYGVRVVVVNHLRGKGEDIVSTKIVSKAHEQVDSVFDAIRIHTLKQCCCQTIEVVTQLMTQVHECVIDKLRVLTDTRACIQCTYSLVTQPSRQVNGYLKAYTFVFSPLSIYLYRN